MATNRGKQFEAKFKEDILKIPGVSFDRLYDQVSGYKTISNISDTVFYKFPEIFYMELKSIHGNTFPLINLTQYDKLIQKKGIKGVRAGAVIWFVDRDEVIYVPIETFELVKKAGYKSIHVVKTDRNKYPILHIPSVKKRVFMDSDYSVLFKDVKYYEDYNKETIII